MTDALTKWCHYGNPQETEGNFLGHTLSATVVTSAGAYFLITTLLITSSIPKQRHAKCYWQGEPA